MLSFYSTLIKALFHSCTLVNLSAAESKTVGDVRSCPFQHSGNKVPELRNSSILDKMSASQPQQIKPIHLLYKLRDSGTKSTVVGVIH